MEEKSSIIHGSESILDLLIGSSIKSTIVFTQDYFPFVSISSEPFNHSLPSLPPSIPPIGAACYPWLILLLLPWISFYAIIPLPSWFVEVGARASFCRCLGYPPVDRDGSIVTPFTAAALFCRTKHRSSEILSSSSLSTS